MLQARQILPAPLPTVFEFFANPQNLQELTPSFLNFEILTTQTAVALGSLIDYRLRLYGIPFGWTSEITAWEPMRRFVDEQRRGPYREWIHEHRFTPQGHHTLVEDVVQYSVPGGALIERLFVRPRLQGIFDHRREALLRRFGESGLATLEFSDRPLLHSSAPQTHG